MNILIDSFPETVEVDGDEYTIWTDFRYALLFSLMMDDPDLADEEKVVQALELFYPVISDDIGAALQAVMDFFKCGKPERKTAGNASGKSGGWVYSFEHDDSYIYSAFMQQYRIDLNDVDMHWWKFKALFEALSPDTLFKQIVKYRAVEINSEMAQEEKQFYQDMKRIYALPDRVSESERERIAKLEEALINGNGLEGLAL